MQRMIALVRCIIAFVHRIIAFVRCVIAFVHCIIVNVRRMFAIVRRMFVNVQRMFASVQEMYSPATLNIPNGNGLPHSVQLRARFFIGNDLVGLYSEIYTVVTTP